MKCCGQVCLITKISNQFGYNKYTVINVDSGEEWVAFGYQLVWCDEVTVDEIRVVEEENSSSWASHTGACKEQ